MARFFKNKLSGRLLRIFFATDLHGSEHAFRKFINAAKFYEANVLIMGGDVLGKMIIPVVKDRHGRYRATVQGETEEVGTEGELGRLLNRIGTQGAYSKVMSEEEYQAVQSEPSALDDLFHELACKRLTDWVDFAETRLKGTGVKCYITGGNDDYPDTLVPLQREDLESVVGCEGKEVQVTDQYTMISLGLSGPTPWKTPRETDEETLAQTIEAMVVKVADMNHCIFNLHDPTLDSTLDTCPMLDWNTDPPKQVVRGGQVVMYGAGSSAVRKAIEKHQPLLGLHGHIHESPGAIRLGRTLCINPGSEYGEGILRGALVTLNGSKIEHYQLTTG
jgi:Icc-related predicted phosphoesterase